MLYVSTVSPYEVMVMTTSVPALEAMNWVLFAVFTLDMLLQFGQGYYDNDLKSWV